MSVLPREHGAYGQIAFPLITAYAVAGVTTPALLIGLATVAAFLAHEPLLVLAGGRGLRVRRECFVAAVTWFTFTGVAAVGAGVGAVWLVPSRLRWSFLVPLVPAVLLAWSIFAKREKTTIAEIAVALTLSLTPVPLCLAANASTAVALGIGIVFGVIFVTGTLSVRGIVLGVRGGGNPRVARSTRSSVLALATVAAVILITAASRALLPPTAALAALPGLFAAAVLAMFPPAPSRLRAVGWILVTTSAAAAVMLIAGLAH